jgi:hypothetical protein
MEFEFFNAKSVARHLGIARSTLHFALKDRRCPRPKKKANFRAIQIWSREEMEQLRTLRASAPHSLWSISRPRQGHAMTRCVFAELAEERRLLAEREARDLLKMVKRGGMTFEDALRTIEISAADEMNLRAVTTPTLTADSLWLRNEIRKQFLRMGQEMRGKNERLRGNSRIGGRKTRGGNERTRARGGEISRISGRRNTVALRRRADEK